MSADTRAATLDESGDADAQPVTGNGDDPPAWTPGGDGGGAICEGRPLGDETACTAWVDPRVAARLGDGDSVPVCESCSAHDVNSTAKAIRRHHEDRDRAATDAIRTEVRPPR